MKGRLFFLSMCLAASASAQESPTNVTYATAAPLAFDVEALLVPAFQLAGEQWWRWTAPRDGLLTVTAPYAAVWIRDELEHVGGQGLPLSVPLARGTNYFIKAVADAPVEVLLRFDSLPNDHFADALVLEEVATISTLVRGSTLEPNEPPDNAHRGGSVWWRWSPPRDGVLRLPFGFHVFHGDALEALVFADRQDDDWVVRGGSTYALAFTETGPVETQVALQPGPRHGSFAERLDLGSELPFKKHVFLPRSVGFQNPYIPATWWEWEAPAVGALMIESSGRLEIRRYKIDEEQGLILDETDTVSAGTRYAFEITTDSGPTSDVITMKLIPVVSGNTSEESPYVIADGLGFAASAGSNTGSLHWRWHASAPGLVRLEQGLLSGWPAGLLPIQVRRSDQSEFEEASPAFVVESGFTYHFRQGTLGAEPNEPHVFQLNVYPVPTNDDRAQAIELGSAPIIRSRSSWVGATREPDELESVVQSLWWTWTAPEDGAVWLRAREPAGHLAVVDGESGALLARGWQEGLLMATSAGQKLAIAFQAETEVGDWGAELSLDFEAGPMNDAFAKAFDLGSQSDIAVDVPGVATTRESDEPLHGAFEPSPEQTDSRWWRWRSAADQRAVVQANGPISVYTGPSVESLTRVPLVLGVDGLEFVERGGTLYHLAWTEPESGVLQEAVQLRLNENSLAGNDAFANRIPLSSATKIRRLPDSSFGSREDGEPAHALGPERSSLWWTWTASGNLRVQIENGLLGVYTGESLDALEPVSLLGDDAMFTTGSNSYRVFEAEAGTTYQIATPVRPLTWKTIPTDLVRHDDFSHARDLGEAKEATLTGSFVGSTSDAVERALVPGTEGGILWWRWTSPGNGLARFTYRGGAVSVFQGADMSGLTKIPVHPGEWTFPVNGLESYWIATGSTHTSDVSFGLVMLTSREIYLAWAAEGLPGRSAQLQEVDGDPDLDSLPNLLEFAVGSDPAIAEANWIAYDFLENTLTLPFNVKPDVVRVMVQSSADLLLWRVLTEGIDYTVADVEGRRFADFESIHGSPLFYRVFAQLR